MVGLERRELRVSVARGKILGREPLQKINRLDFVDFTIVQWLWQPGSATWASDEARSFSTRPFNGRSLIGIASG